MSIRGSISRLPHIVAYRLGFLADFNKCHSNAVLLTTDVASRGLNLKGVRRYIAFCNYLCNIYYQNSFSMLVDHLEYSSFDSMLYPVIGFRVYIG